MTLRNKPYPPPPDTAEPDILKKAADHGGLFAVVQREGQVVDQDAVVLALFDGQILNLQHGFLPYKNPSLPSEKRIAPKTNSKHLRASMRFRFSIPIQAP